MFHTTEYAAKFVWHENAYIKPPLQICRHSLNLGKKECEETPLPFPFHKEEIGNVNQQHHHLAHPLPHDQEETKDEIQKENQDEILAKLANACCLHRDSLSALHPYPMKLDSDARGIKSHFLPASIEVLLDLADQSCATRGMPPRSNQYFTSVYKRDFSSAKNSISS